VNADYNVEHRNGSYYLTYKGMPLGFASQKIGGWWWVTQLPGRRGGRKGFNSVMDCMASGSRVRKSLVRELVLKAVGAEMDRIVAVADKRRDAADDAIRALRPTGVDWMKPGELERFEALRLEHIRLSPTTKETQKRVAAKRAVRRAAARTREG